MSETLRSEVDLPKLIERFGSEDKCHAYLEELRWPEGVKCPRCGSDKISRIKARRQFDCDGCRYQFSVRVGTVLQDSKLPLWKWFLAVYMMCEARKGVSANQLKRMLGVSYKTAWFLCHRIRSAMIQDGELLRGTVEMDELYVGGKARGKGHGYRGNKTMVMGAIERGGKLRVQAMPGKHLTRESAHSFVAGHIDDKAENIYTDENLGYPDLTDWNTKHRRVNHSQEEWVRGDIHTNTVESAWSLFDRAVIGSYHKLSVKHLNAYLDEFAFRFNNRDNPFLFRDTILALVEADVLTFQDLTHPA
jgi:transposase-like protein